jgi:hypothetical protein
MAIAKPGKSLKPANLRPYLAPVLLEATGSMLNKPLLAAVAKEIEKAAGRSSDRIVRRLLESEAMGTASGLHLHGIAYSEVVSPAWYLGKGYANVAHELIVVAVRGKNVMICASDGTARDRIVKNLKSAKPMPPGALSGFVGAEAAAIWLRVYIRRRQSRLTRSS